MDVKEKEKNNNNKISSKQVDREVTCKGGKTQMLSTFQQKNEVKL